MSQSSNLFTEYLQNSEKICDLLTHHFLRQKVLMTFFPISSMGELGGPNNRRSRFVIYILLLGLFIGNFWYFNWLHQFTWHDIMYYADFVHHFPLLYSTDTFGCYSVLYLPHFIFFSWPLSFLSETVGYLIMSVINLLLLLRILFEARTNPPILYWSIVGILCLTISSLARWGNAGIAVLYISLRTYNTFRKNQHLTWGQVWLFAFFSFKIVNLLFLPLFALDLHLNNPNNLRSNFRTMRNLILRVGGILVILQLPYLFPLFDNRIGKLKSYCLSTSIIYHTL